MADVINSFEKSSQNMISVTYLYYVKLMLRSICFLQRDKRAAHACLKCHLECLVWRMQLAMNRHLLTALQIYGLNF